MADWIVEPERRTAVAGEFDVVVAGGGTAGPVAAIAAARAGATVALVERFGVLGGGWTVGRCSHLGNRYVDERPGESARRCLSCPLCTCRLHAGQGELRWVD